MKNAVLLLTLIALPLLAADPMELKLWPDGAPGKMQPHSKATDDFIRTKAGKSTITDIIDPTITVYRPEKPNGTAVIVAPGGGYVFLSAAHEGTQVCEWLNTLGVTGILLKYRTPTRDEAAPHEKPVADASRAIALVREHTKDWNLDPKRVGLLGFSAGGNLLAHLACDLFKAGPDFGIMIYGGGFIDPKEPAQFKPGFTVPSDAPPMFLACAHDDGQNPVAATVLYLEYKKHDIPCELHLFTKGGHGFGMRDNKQPINAWPQRCAEWMGAMGWMPNLAKLDAEIQKRREGLARFAQLPKWICWDDIPILEREIQAARQEQAEADAVNDKNKSKALGQKIMEKEAFLKEYSASLEESSRNLQTALEEAKRLQKEITRFEAERDSLLQQDAKNKAP